MDPRLAEYRAKKKEEQRRQEPHLITKWLRQTLSTFVVWCRYVQQRWEPKKEISSELDEVAESAGCADTGKHLADGDERPGDTYLILGLKAILWGLCFGLAIELEFGLVFFTCSLLFFMYKSMAGRRKDGLSAYSVFNPRCERLDGTFTAEQFENQLLHRKPPSSPSY